MQEWIFWFYRARYNTFTVLYDTAQVAHNGMHKVFSIVDAG